MTTWQLVKIISEVASDFIGKKILAEIGDIFWLQEKTRLKTRFRPKPRVQILSFCKFYSQLHNESKVQNGLKSLRSLNLLNYGAIISLKVLKNDWMTLKQV